MRDCNATSDWTKVFHAPAPQEVEEVFRLRFCTDISQDIPFPLLNVYVAALYSNVELICL